jgi:putative protein-disulfide isomerase
VAIVEASYYTDPACPWSWALEPSLRRLQVEFGSEVSIVPVMGGLAPSFDDPQGELARWLDAFDRSGMPFDPRVWMEAPPRSSHPACLAVVAVGMQGEPVRDRVLRRLREGLMCGRRTLDTPDALLAEARRTPGVDGARLARDLGSSATVERFGAELERTKRLGGPSALPAIAFRGADGEERLVRGFVPYDDWRAAALAAAVDRAGAAALRDARDG